MATTAFNDLITFSRGSNATVTGPNGLIQWAPNNLLTNSQDFEAAFWPKSNVTVTANTATAPDGTTTAELMYPTTTGSTRRILRGTSLTIGSIYAQSIYVKAAGKQWVYLNGVDATSSANDCWFDLQNGVVGTKGASVLSAGISPVGDGWYRIFTTGAAGVNNFFYLMTVDGDNSLIATTNGTDGILIWGAQLEIGSTATTYNNTSVRNLLGFSEAFDNAAWTKDRCSIVTGAQANPVNGLFNAQKLMEDTTASASHRTRQTVNLSGVPVTFSAYLKAGERNWAYLRLDDASSVKYAYFNLSTGVAGFTTSGITSSITSVGNGWYRCSTTFAAPAATATGVAVIGLATANTPDTYTGDGNSGVYIYGAQLSNSASLDPYVPTPGAAPSSTAYYGPRFDFDPVTLLPRGLLVEEQRTNLFTYSDDFANAAWTKSSATITANQAVSPDGTTNADLLQITAQFGRLQAGSVTLGTVYTFSIWARTASGTRVYSLYDAAGNPIGTLTATTAWTRHTITFTAPATSTLYVMQDRNAGPFVDTFIYGAQLEAGAFATSYIPTVASTVTRSADVATITGSLFSQWYNQNEGGLIAEISSFGIGSNLPTFVNVSDGTTSNYIRFNGASGYLARNFVASGGSTVANITVGAGLAANTPIKAAVVYANNSFNVAASGATGTEDTSGAVPVAQNQMVMGNWFTSAGTFLNGHIRNIRFIPARAADFQLQGLST
jgi:hypothetical protein